MPRYVVTLTQEEREKLEVLTSKGKHRSRKVINALILLAVDEGEFNEKEPSKNEDIARILNTTTRTVNRVKSRFVFEGFDVALNGRKTTRLYKKKIDGDAEAHIIALSCSDPPEGFGQWSLRLLADKAVELGYIDSISHESVRRVLKKTNSNRGKK